MYINFINSPSICHNFHFIPPLCTLLFLKQRKNQRKKFLFIFAHAKISSEKETRIKREKRSTKYTSKKWSIYFKLFFAFFHSFHLLIDESYTNHLFVCVCVSVCAFVFMFHFLLQDFVQGLSILSRGSVEEKLRWTFQLYDINGDGYITREEMTDIVTAIYELMGRLPDELPEEEKIKGKVERIFQVRKKEKKSHSLLFALHLTLCQNKWKRRERSISYSNIT